MAVWNDIVAALGQLITLCYHLTGSYGLAIILLTVAIRLALWPLTLSQVSSMRRMQMLQPQLQKLQQRYKNDREKLNQETMRLWRDNHVNPASGCLPLLVQLPILWAIYAALESFKFQGPASFLWIPNLAHVDPYVLPILGGLTTFWQTRISTFQGAGNPSQQAMVWIMPLFIIFIFRRLPAGLGVYWVVSNLVSIIQQYVAGGPPRPAAGTAGAGGGAGGGGGGGGGGRR